MKRKRKNKKRVPKKTVREKLTLWGIYNKYKKDLEKHWDKKARTEDEKRTAKQYKSNFRDILSPYFEDKPFAEYSYKEIIEILNKIKISGYTRKGKNKYYSEHKMDTLLSNIKSIDKISVVKGIRSVSLFWGTAVSLANYDILNNDIYAPKNKDKNDIIIENLIAENISLRKSLTTPEEAKVFEKVMTNPEQSGEFMGIALMFAFGLRNSEACGVEFGDILPMTGHEDCYRLIIRKTATRSREITATTKTENAYRSIPIYGDKLLDFLIKRKEYVKRKLNICDEEVNKLTIACVKDDFHKPCNTNDLTQAGKVVLKYANVDSRVVAFIEINHSKLTKKHNEVFKQKLIEKEPTAYLFRRHFGTILEILGLSLNEIQYLMGHSISSVELNRYNFTNPDLLYKMKKKLDERTLFSSTHPQNNESVLEAQTSRTIDSLYRQIIGIPKGSRKREIVISIKAKTPNDSIHIRIETDSEIPSEVQRHPMVEQYDSDKSEPLNSIKTYHNMYRKYEKKNENSEAG
ncbi:MAG: site-specific integrase [Ruminococcus sp.]|nr:site-specific integrase [Ruminococcus sp.]